MTRTQQADVAGGAGQDLLQPGAVPLIAVGHQDHGIVGGGFEGTEARRSGDAAGRRETLRAGPLCAAIEDVDGPAEEGGHAHHGLSILPRAEDVEALWRGEVLDEGLCGADGLALEEQPIAPVADLPCQTGGTLGEGGDDGTMFALERGGQGFKGGMKLGCMGRFKQDVDRAAAAEAIGNVGGVVKEGGVTLDDGALANKPGGFADDFGFQAAAGDGTNV